jgi:preprotein translocase subunit SecY
VIERLTFIGSFLLATVATLPNIIAILFGISDFTGLSISSLVIVTGIIIDLEREIEDIVFSNVYLA